jgi:hypothetical protein
LLINWESKISKGGGNFEHSRSSNIQNPKIINLKNHQSHIITCIDQMTSLATKNIKNHRSKTHHIRKTNNNQIITNITEPFSFITTTESKTPTHKQQKTKKRRTNEKEKERKKKNRTRERFVLPLFSSDLDLGEPF